MNMKNITKTGLNDFITRKVNANKNDVRAEINKVIDVSLEPIFKKMIDVKKVEDAAYKFTELMNTAIESYGSILKNWKYQQTVSDVNHYAVTLGTKIKDEVKSKFNEHVFNQQKGVHDFGIPELNETLKTVKETSAPLLNRIYDLEKLQREIERVIKVEANGGRAYKALVALGVDMTEYEETSANLPAIVKLSVDVCVLNGDCNKQESA